MITTKTMIKINNIRPKTRISSVPLKIYDAIVIAHPTISQALVCEIKEFPNDLLITKDDISCMMTPPSPSSSIDELTEELIIIEEAIKQED